MTPARNPKLLLNPTDRTIADVEIGGTYSVVVGGHSRSVRIVSRVSSGVWFGLNIQSGRNLYVTFGDLGERLDRSPGDLRPPPSIPPALDHKQLAAGEKEEL
jgi:hypothetical protein